MPKPLHVHIFGGSSGESIVLGLPDNRWGVIDIFMPDLADPSSSPVVRFLSDQKIQRLEFLCLTHPHADHVRGASHLVKSYGIRRFLGFGTTTMSELYNRIVKILKCKAARLNDSEPAQEMANDLLKALSEVNQRVKQRAIILERVVAGSLLLEETVQPGNIPLRIMAIAPSGRSVLRYDEGVSACFDRKRRDHVLLDKVSNVNENEISSGFLIEYGSHRVVLGGDIETEAWRDVVNHPLYGKNLAADLVKVSHHGSENGYCENLWEHHLSPAKAATAVVTAFTSKGLPRATGISHLKKNAARLVTTSLSSLKPARTGVAITSPFSSLPLDARILLEGVFTNASSPNPEHGACSYGFEGQGKPLETLTGDAGPIV